MLHTKALGGCRKNTNGCNSEPLDQPMIMNMAAMLFIYYGQCLSRMARMIIRCFQYNILRTYYWVQHTKSLPLAPEAS